MARPLTRPSATLSPLRGARGNGILLPACGEKVREARMRGFVYVAMLFVVCPIFASVSVKRSVDQPKKVDVAVINEPLSSAVSALEMYLPHTVKIVVTGDPKATFRAKHVDPEGALRAVALSAGVAFAIEDDRYVLRSRKEQTVTLDVKDEEITKILASMKAQCGVRNMVIDRDVQGKGTFLFDNLPCRTAFDIVFRTMGLASVDYGNSTVTVGTRRR